MLPKRWFHLGVCLTVAMAGTLMMSGCTSGPRYGTDKTAFQQLTDDLGKSTSLTGAEPKNKGVKYTPRPGLVLPSTAEKDTLVEPQQSIASKDNPQWIESPEETRSRLVKDADDNSGKSSFRSPLASNAIEGGRRTTQEQTQAYRDARALQKGAYIDQRRSISDPPTEYRQADDPSKLDDLGEPELKKQKKKKKEAAVAGSGKQWWNLLQ